MSVKIRSISKVLLSALMVTLLQVVPSAEWLSPASAGYPNPAGISSTTAADTNTGAYIIDVGALSAGKTTQTLDQGVAPYGLVYELVRAKIPVLWIINPDKQSNDAGNIAFDQTLGNNGVDFTFDCMNTGTAKSYKTGAFVITPEFAAQAKPYIDNWTKTSPTSPYLGGHPGTVIDGQCVNPLPSLRSFATIKSWPRAVLDAQNGSVAVPYFTNAGIPQGSLTDPLNPPAYRTAAPSALTACDDIYVMPHADPTYGTHSNLITFIKQGGNFYASCHAVSVVENMTDGASTDKVMSFLSTNGLLNYDAHSQGSPPYSIYDTTSASVSEFAYSNSYSVYTPSAGTGIAKGTTASAGTSSYTLPSLQPGDPIAQFYGRTDAAQQQGSEQIFMPAANSRWRSTTQILIYDQSQTNSGTGATPVSPLTSPGPAASLLYGPAFGNSNYGQVMYVGGHSSNKGTVDDVASQRAFFNFLLLTSTKSSSTPSASDRTPTVSMTSLGTTKFKAGETIQVSGSATGGSGVYKYSWASSCYDRNGNPVSGGSGSFLSTTSASTTFTPPTFAGVANCNLTLTAIDSCGRFAFGFENVSVAPTSDVKVVQTFAGPYTKGTPFTSTIVVTNQGPDTAGYVVVKSTAPSNATFTSVGSPVFSGSAPSGTSCSIASGILTCLLQDMLSGQTATIQLTITPNSTITSANNNLSNVVSVSTLSYDPDLSNNSDSDSILVAEASPAPLLEVTKTPANQVVNSGGTAQFSIRVKNVSTGEFTFTSITLTDTYSTGGTLTCDDNGDGSSSPTSSTSTSKTWTITNLEKDATWIAACKIAGVTATGTNSLTAVGTADPGAVVVNQSATPVQITLSSAPTISKTLISGTVSPGQDITYRVIETNTTTSTISGIKFVDTLPAYLTYKAGSAVVVAPSSSSTGRVVMLDKFDVSTVGTSASTWTSSTSTGGSTSSKVKLSGSDKATGKAVSFTFDSNSSSSNSTNTYSITKNVSINSDDADLTILFECYSKNNNESSATAPKITVTLGSATYGTDGTCSSSQRSYPFASPVALKVSDLHLVGSPATVALTFTVTGSGNKEKYWTTYLDDIEVVAGLKANDAVLSSYSQDKIYTSSLSTSLGRNLWFKPSSSTTNTYSVSLPTALKDSGFGTVNVGFTYANVALSTGEYLKLGTDSSCSTSPWTIPALTANGSFDTDSKGLASSMVSATYSFTASSSITKIYFCFNGTHQIAVDDIVIYAGSGASAPSSTDPLTALTGPYTLKAGEVVSVTYTVHIPNPYPDGWAMGIVNLVTGSSTSDTKTVSASDGKPFTPNPLVVIKTVDTATVVAGQYPTFTYKVKNTGGTDLTSVTISDDGCTPITKVGGGSSPYTVGAHSELTFTCSVSNDTKVTTATTSGTVTVQGSIGGTTYTTSAYLVIKKLLPAITVAATPTPVTIYQGSKVAYTFTVTNTGNWDLSSVHTNSSHCAVSAYTSGDTNSDQILQTDETSGWVFKCLSEPFNTAGTFTETVTATAENTFNNDPVTSTTVNLTVIVVGAKPVLHLTKSVSNSGSGDAGPAATLNVGASNTITDSYTVTATGGSVTNVFIADDSCSVGNTHTGDSNSNSKLDVGEAWVYSCAAGTLMQSETGTAVAYGKAEDVYQTNIQSDEAATRVNVVIPGLLLTVEPQHEYVIVGSNNTYTYTVTNTGTVDFLTFTGSDSHCTATSPQFTLPSGLAVGATHTFTCTYPIPVDTVTNFIGSGTYTGGASAYVADTATVNVFAIDPQFTVAKTVIAYTDATLQTIRDGSETSTAVTAEIGDTLVFTYKLSASKGTNATGIDSLNSIFKSSFTDADCDMTTFADSLNSDGYNIGDLNNSGYMDPGEVWVYTCNGNYALTNPGAGLRIAPVSQLAKIRNGGLMSGVSAKALVATAPLGGFKYATSTHNSPVTVQAQPSIDNTLSTLSGTSSVVITLNGVTTPVTPPAGPSPTLLTPKITWPNPSQQVGPWTLAPGQLNASCSVPGSTLTYSPAIGAVLQPGTYVLTVTCTPPAGSGYGPLTTTVPFTVVKPEAKITWPTPTPVTGPVVLGPNQLNAECSIPGGTLAYDPARYAKLTAGTYTLKVTCTPPAGSIYSAVSTTVQFVVTEPGKVVLDPPSAPVMKIVSGTSSTIAWVKSPNAIGYYVTLDGSRVCTTNALKCTIKKLVGPKSDVKIYATKGSLTSAYVVPVLKKSAKPQVIGMVFFDSAKYNIKADQKAEIKRVAGLLKKLGYTDVIIGGHTDSNAYDNLTLSNNRALSTQDALSKLVPGLNVDLHYSGATQPMASNSTLTGQAKNRRAEIAVW